MSDREHEAWEARYKHAKAASNWRAIAVEGAAVDPNECNILAIWMQAYADADAIAEASFRSLNALRRELPVGGR